MRATISVAPGAQAGERWNLHIGAWDDPDRMYLPGFATWWDVWAFCICNGMNDPLPDTPANKKSTLNRPKEKPAQMKMFVGDTT